NRSAKVAPECVGPMSAVHEYASGHGAAEYHAVCERENESLSMKTRTQKSRLNRNHARMRRALLGLEALEGRQLMASDLVSLAPDSLLAIQDQTSQILDVLANDSFDSAYPGARQITAVSAGDRGGEFSISPDGRSVRYTPPPGFFSNEIQSPATIDPALLDSNFSDSENFTYVVDGAFEQSARVYVRPVVSRDSYE